jgi:O-antigen ligase
MITPSIQIEPCAETEASETSEPRDRAGSRSFLEARGLTPIDALAVVVAASMVALLIPAGLGNWASRIAVLLALVPLGLLYLVRSVRARDHVAVLLGSLLVAVAVSSLLSGAPWLSLLGSFKHLTSFLIYLGGACAFCVGTRVSGRGQSAIGWAVVWASALSGVFAVIELVTNPAAGSWSLSDGRPPGLTVHPVFFGAFAAASGAWFAYRLMHRVAVADLAGLAMSSALVTLSGSRVALLAVVVFTLLAIVRAGERRAWVGMLAVALGAACASAFHRALGSSQSSIDRGTTSGLEDRLDLWSYGLRAWSERPLFGWGPGRYATAISGQLSNAWINRFGNSWPDAHNVGLEWLTTMGIVGLVVGVAFVGVACIRARGPLAWMAGAIAIGWLLEPATAGTLGLAALLLGASTGAHGVRSLEAAGPDRSPRLGGVELLACFVGLLLGGWYLVGDFSADVTPPAVRADGAVHWWYSHDPEVALAISDGFGNRVVGQPGGSPEAVEWAQRAVDDEPDSPRWRAALAARLFHVGDLDRARVAAEDALELQRNNPIALYVLQAVGERTGDDQAVARATEALCDLDKCPEGASIEPADNA